jgi:hypothetical protein
MHSRLITIDIDVFIESLKLLVSEDEPFEADKHFNESGLTYEGLDKIVSYPKELLENIYAEKHQLKRN